MTHLKQAQKWYAMQYPMIPFDEHCDAYQLAVFFDEQEKSKECEHDNKSYYARSWRCSDCGATGLIEPQPTPVPEELHKTAMSMGVAIDTLWNKLNEVIRYLRYLQQRSKE